MSEFVTSQNTAMLLIRHQVGTMGWIRSTEFDELEANALALAKAAKAKETTGCHAPILKERQEFVAEVPWCDNAETARFRPAQRPVWVALRPRLASFTA